MDTLIVLAVVVLFALATYALLKRRRARLAEDERWTEETVEWLRSMKRPHPGHWR